MRMIFAPFRRTHIRTGLALALCSAAVTAFAAQGPAARISADVNASEVSVLKNSQHPLANPAFDAGRMPAATRMNGVTIDFARSAAQDAELDALLAAQQDPSSAQYHRWLTPDDFAARFGMAQSDLAKVSAWLQQQGFSVDSVNRSRNAIHFSGSVAQIEAAFRTEMHFYTVNGETHFAPSTALSVPSAIAPTVMSVRNLTSFKPHPNHVPVKPNFTSGQFTSGVSGNSFFAPGDIATAYDIKSLTSGGDNGAGQSIAIMGQSSVALTDIEAFQSAAGLTVKDPELVLVPGTGSPAIVKGGDEGESDLDLEWSGGVATGAHIVFVYTGNNPSYGVFNSVQYAIDENIGQIISISYSACETELSVSEQTSLEAMFKQAATQGQTVMAASGDQGSTSCATSTNLTSAQRFALAVNYPASSAYVTGVGGTETSTANATSSTYWNATSGTDVINSLKKYIPEVAWNDDSTGNPLSSTGGGVSTFVPRPAWQAGVPGIPSGSMRLVPDVAFYSSPQNVGYLYCTSDSGTNPTSCTAGFRDSAGNLTVAGGTSFATPVFAGMLAVLNQKLNYTTGQGLINPELYKLASNSSTYTSAFHDVTSGDNNCTAGATYCGTTTGGFTTNAGYDEVTGLGSVDLANLAAAWPANSGSSSTQIATTTGVSAASGSPALNAADVFTITVTSGSGATVPTGSVTLQIDGGTAFGGTTVANKALAANGTVTYSATFTTPCSHQVLAQYAGDATHAPSVGAAEITVPGCGGSSGSLGVKATDVTVAQGSSADSTVTVSPAGGFTGQVLLSLSSTSTQLNNLCYSFPTQNSQGQGEVIVTAASAVTTTLSLDANARDCATTGAVAATGKRPVTIVATSGKSGGAMVLHSSNRTPAGGNRAPMGLAFAGLILAGCLARGSRKLRALACVVALAAIALGATACGSSTTTANNPPKGTYTLQISAQDATSGTITAQNTFTLTID